MTARRLLAVVGVALAFVGSTLLAATAQATPRIAGGQIVSAGEAPWAVSIFVDHGGYAGVCSGSLIASDQVLTAGHCLGDALGGTIQVYAGVTGSAAERPIAEQYAEATSYRVHPYFRLDGPSGQTDDVAVLRLDRPFTPTEDVEPIAVGPGLSPSTGDVRVYGFGFQTQTRHDDYLLRRADFSLLPRESSCDVAGVGGSATQRCATSATDATCGGDSGSGLVSGNTPAVLIGVLGGESYDANSPDDQCTAAARSYFADLGSREIRDFVAGSDRPPRAPRGGLDAGVRGDATSLTCTPGTWSEQPSFSFAWTDELTGETLSTTQTLQRPARHAEVRCTVTADTDGGQGRLALVVTTDPPPIVPPVVSTTATSGIVPPVSVAPPAPTRPAATSPSQRATIRLRVPGLIHGHRKIGRSRTLSFAIADAPVRSVQIEIERRHLTHTTVRLTRAEVRRSDVTVRVTTEAGTVTTLRLRIRRGMVATR